jgi:hypothetical protein
VLSVFVLLLPSLFRFASLSAVTLVSPLSRRAAAEPAFEGSFLPCLVVVVVEEVVVELTDDPRLLFLTVVSVVVVFVFSVVGVVVGAVFKVVDDVGEAEIMLPLLSIFIELTVV